jgi:4-carboxymuconolactone decarboxylase
VTALEELGLMLHLYAGFPATIEYLRALRAGQGAATRSSSRARPRTRSAATANLRAWRARGEALCARVYGEDYAELRAFTRRLHPAIDAWMIVDGYGKTLSRPGLGALERELATVAALAATGWPRQLAAHRAGAVRVGASARAVREAETIGREVARSWRATGSTEPRVRKRA